MSQQSLTIVSHNIQSLTTHSRSQPSLTTRSLSQHSHFPSHNNLSQQAVTTRTVSHYLSQRLHSARSCSLVQHKCALRQIIHKCHPKPRSPNHNPESLPDIMHVAARASAPIETTRKTL